MNYAACGALVLLQIVSTPGVDCGESEPSCKLTGRVTFQGEVPAAALPDGQGRREPLLDVEPGSGGLRWAVVFLLPASPSGKAIAETDEVASSTPPRRIIADRQRDLPEMDQLDYRFVPRVIAVQAGEEVRFSNSDVANHNVRAAALSPLNQFNIYTGTGGEHVHRFEADAKQRPVQISCDIHPWMRAWVYVLEHPYFAVTDRHGRFEITAPAGTYRFVVRQPDTGLSRETTVQLKTGESAPINTRFDASDVKR